MLRPRNRLPQAVPRLRVNLRTFAMMVLAAALAAAPPPADAQQGGAAKQGKPATRGKAEKLYCTLGTEHRQARITVELLGGKVESLAYYSKWTPRTCSVHLIRDDAFSVWKNTGDVTVVTLNEDKGAFLIDHDRSKIHFIFRDIDRERFCGMDGKINGSLTIWRGRQQCEIDGILDEHGSEMKVVEPAKPAGS